MGNAFNIRLKGTRFHFRKKIPDNLRNRLGRSEIVRSLDTRERRVANARARQVWLVVEGVLDQVRSDITLTKAQIESVLNTMLADLDWADEIRLAQNGVLFDHHGDAPIDADAVVMETYAYDYREALARNDVSLVKQELAKVIPKFEGPLTALDERLVGRALLELLADGCDRSAERMRNSIYPFLHAARAPISAEHDDGSSSVPTLGHDLVEPTVVPKPAIFDLPATTMTFSEAWSDTIEDNVANHGWDKGRINHASSTLKLWLRIHGDIPLPEVTRAHAVHFRRTLARLPDRYHRDRRWAGLKPGEIVADADAIDESTLDGEPKLRRINPKTVNRHISQLNTIWENFITLDHLPKGTDNPFKGLHIPVKKSDDEIKEERDQFTLEEVQKMFSSPVWTGSKSPGRRKLPGDLIIQDWRYWVPLMGAYSGMRREEICALQVEDFELMNGIWFVNLRRSKKRLKTPGSPRYVPVHRHLIEWGIIECLVNGRKGSDWVFPELTPSAVTNRRGEPFGKWFTPLRRKLKIDRPGVVFHSFRHTVSTMLHNAECYPPFIEEITGHESKERRSEIKRYTKATLVQKLKDTIDRLDYGLVLRAP